MKNVKVIDLFAGPGGLGEGFSAFKYGNSNPFKIAISIEKEASAHQTLTLRAFLRQFGDSPPGEYFDFLEGKLGAHPEDQLYNLTKFKTQVIAAKKEARQLTLGVDDAEIYPAIASAIGKDECILIGGPPCQAYSLVGRARNRGIQDYDPQQDHRNFLYLEYLMVIAQFQPAIFIMENVKGMLSASLDGKRIFASMLEDLRDPSASSGAAPVRGKRKHQYRIVSLNVPLTNDDLFADDKELSTPTDFVTRSELHGVPQRRHRVILAGIREDLADNWRPEFALQMSEPVTPTIDVLKDLPELRSGLSKGGNSASDWLAAINANKNEIAKHLQKMDSTLAEAYLANVSALKSPAGGQGKNFALKKTRRLKIKNHPKLTTWLASPGMERITVNHATRGHIVTDLHRYMFCSTWAELAGLEDWPIKSPKANDFPEILKPAHKNFDSGKFADRFRVQIAGAPASTITSHISKDGHYFIHPDPRQCRSLTVREAARIQTFPDDYFFVGNRTQQYVQVGNAVPPYLAVQIAESVFGLLKSSKLT